jgi:hypothetical protein
MGNASRLALTSASHGAHWVLSAATSSFFSRRLSRRSEALTSAHTWRKGAGWRGGEKPVNQSASQPVTPPSIRVHKNNPSLQKSPIPFSSHRHVDKLVLANFRRINVNVHDLSTLGKHLQLARHAVVKAHAQRNQEVRLWGLQVGQGGDNQGQLTGAAQRLGLRSSLTRVCDRPSPQASAEAAPNASGPADSTTSSPAQAHIPKHRPQTPCSLTWSTA